MSDKGYGGGWAIDLCVAYQSLLASPRVCRRLTCAREYAGVEVQMWFGSQSAMLTRCAKVWGLRQHQPTTTGGRSKPVAGPRTLWLATPSPPRGESGKNRKILGTRHALSTSTLVMAMPHLVASMNLRIAPVYRSPDNKRHTDVPQGLTIGDLAR